MLSEKCAACWTCTEDEATVEFVTIHTTNGALRLCRQCLDDINRKNPEVKRWQDISTAPTTERIRVIGANSFIVIGDIFFGPASMMIGRMGDEEYVRERSEAAWRYSQGEDKVLPHMQPTRWMPLPDLPKE